MTILTLPQQPEPVAHFVDGWWPPNDNEKQVIASGEDVELEVA